MYQVLIVIELNKVRNFLQQNIRFLYSISISIWKYTTKIR